MKAGPSMPRMMPVVVTGAAGFIGRRVVSRLAAAGLRVRAVDRLPAPQDLPPAVEYRRADLRADLGWVPEPGTDGFMLVHLAWNMNRADASGQTASVGDFTRLLETLPGRGLRAAVGLGSAEEYGEQEGQLREDQAPGTRLSAYGQAKHEACRALDAWSRTGGRKAIWLRPFIVYGPGQGGDMVVPYALRCARERRSAEFTEALQLRDFIHANDVADGIVRAVATIPEQTVAFSACNLGRGEPVRLREVLERIARKTDAADLFHFGARPMRVNEPQSQFADLKLAKTLLKWHARISWEQGVDDLCRGGAE